jgi:thioredoxin reductase
MSARERRGLVVIGGGLAGLTATVEAQRAGLDTCLVEQRATLRGPRSLLSNVRTDACLETVAWGMWGREVAVCSALGPTRVLVADQVILATGAYERPVAFPGWTLPGVMSAGGALRLLEQGASPGQRVLVAGFGCWVTAAAERLRSGGVHVVDVVDAAARAGRLVVRAEGDGALERVVVARVDAEWCPRAGTSQVVETDALVLAFGYLPENQLARLAGCLHEDSGYVSPRTVRDAWMRTSVPGVFVAGDAGGVVGPEAAIEQGRLAGLGAALAAGLLSENEADARARAIRRRLESVTELPRPRAGLYGLADADTLICRCEDVTAREITERLFEGSLEPGPVIAESRAAMGSCQGRNCASQIAAVISHHTGQPIESIPPITPRPPVVPVPVGALAERPPEFEPVADS